MTSILITALAAGLVAILVTVAIERLGGRKGGLLGTLPTTIVPAAVGFWWSSATTVDFRDALFVVPAGMLLNAVFLLFWRELPGRLPSWPFNVKLVAMVVLSMSGWLVLALALLAATEFYRAAGLPMVFWGWGFFCLALLFGVAACLGRRPAPAGSNPVSMGTYLARGLLAALAIGLAVALAGISGPVIAGIVSIFPAIFITTVVALWLSQGETVPSGAVGPMMLGSTSVSAFALFAAAIMPVLGVAAGAVAAWLAAVALVTVPAWLLLQRLARNPVLECDNTNVAQTERCLPADRVGMS